jgi:hypothetical protein
MHNDTQYNDTKHIVLNVINLGIANKPIMHNDTQHNDTNYVVLNVIYAECRK